MVLAEMLITAFVGFILITISIGELASKQKPKENKDNQDIDTSGSISSSDLNKNETTESVPKEQPEDNNDPKTSLDYVNIANKDITLTPEEYKESEPRVKGVIKLYENYWNLGAFMTYYKDWIAKTIKQIDDVSKKDTLLIGFAYSPNHGENSNEIRSRICRSLSVVDELFPSRQKKVICVENKNEKPFIYYIGNTADHKYDVSTVIHQEIYDQNSWTTNENDKVRTIEILPYEKVTDVYLDLLIALDDSPEALNLVKKQVYNKMPVLPFSLLKVHEKERESSGYKSDYGPGDYLWNITGGLIFGDD